MEMHAQFVEEREEQDFFLDHKGVVIMGGYCHGSRDSQSHCP